MLLLLRQPRLKLVYVTSMPVDPAVIEYYLSLLPGVIPSHARARLSLVSVGDSSATPLTEKLLARPRMVGQIRRSSPTAAFSHLVPYNTTRLGTGPRPAARHTHARPRSPPRPARHEDRLARRPSPRRGSRTPWGSTDVRTVDDVVSALPDCASRVPEHRRHGQAQRGRVRGRNAEVDLAGLPASGDASERAALRDRVMTMTLESQKADLPSSSTS